MNKYITRLKDYFFNLLKNESPPSEINMANELEYNAELYIDILTAVYNEKQSINDLFYTKINHKEIHSRQKVEEFVGRLYYQGLVDTELAYNIKYVSLTEHGKEFINNLGIEIDLIRV